MKVWQIIFLVAITLPARSAEPLQPLQPPMPPSPIAEFRTWLTNAEVRQVALAKRSLESRRVIEAKIKVYSDLPVAERERRLTATELQWYVRHLVTMPKTQRNLGLVQVPVIWQPMVMQRLTAWDKMSPELQKEALDHQLVMEYVSAPADKKETVLKSLAPTQTAALRQRLAQWQILPAVERTRLNERLADFFQLPADKQQQTLNNFSDAERRNMEKTLESFRALTREQRDICIRSFSQFAQKFAAMSDAEKMAFLKNAERWQDMPQKDRDVWRQIVAIVPPMPPIPTPVPPIPVQPASAQKAQ